MGSVHTLHKLEKLSHKATIDAIFQKKGKSIFKGPILFVYYKTDLYTPYPCQLMVSVGKRKFKRAVDRNSIKRRITEVYRLRKLSMYNSIGQDSKYAIGILFLGKKMPTYQEIELHTEAAIDDFIKRNS